MGELIVSAEMTADAVIARVDEWFTAGDEHDARSHAQLFAADAMLLGRVTYEGLATVWPTISDDTGFAERVNAMDKYVVSRTLAGPLGWNARLVALDDIAQLRARLNLVMFGCGPLAATLIEAGLVDEVRLGVHPVSIGAGTRVFGGYGPVQLKLIEAAPQRSGVVEYRYRPVHSNR